MFTGIIQAIGTIKDNQQHDKGARFSFACNDMNFSTVDIGDSIAVNGVCLTAIEIGDNFFTADLSQETLDCSVFSGLGVGDSVNLEKALRLNQGIDGHIVSGHVDGVAEVINRYAEGESVRFEIKVPSKLVKYIAKKGSVCINGVSLTVNNIDADVFNINIVPHTLKATTLGDLTAGSRVNIEVDMIARHLEQLINNQSI